MSPRDVTAAGDTRTTSPLQKKAFEVQGAAEARRESRRKEVRKSQSRKITVIKTITDLFHDNLSHKYYMSFSLMRTLADKDKTWF
jgi:hypothetical protein